MTAPFTRLRGALAGRRSHDRLARDLATYRSRADLIELSALFERHDPSDTAQLRRLVDWSAAD